ncbi:uncharacterized protein LOC111489634 isoform X2 [Cucurbita maxima]|nr:uncharacterized protein LOC111489634 isoform X2 [Cucurbita maxima]
MIQKAIAEVGEEDGLSEELISEFIVNEYKDLPWAHPAFLRRHLGKLCESGELVKSKCGKYNFKVEGKEVKRKKRRRKSAGRSRRREVESDDEIEGDIDRIKRSKKLNIRGPCAEEVVTSKGTKEKNDSLIEVIVGAEDGDHALRGQVLLDELEEVQEDEMIDKHHREEIKYKYGANDFNLPKKSRNLVIIGLHAPVAIKGIEKQSRSLGGKVHEAEEGDHAKGGQIQVLGDVKEVQADVMIDQLCEKKVKSRHVIQDIDETRQSQTVAAANLGAQEALAMTGIEAKCGLSREEIGGLMKVRKVGMINDPHKVEVKSTDRAEDFGEIKQSQDLMVVGLHAKKALTTKGTEDQCSSLRKNVVGAEGGCEQAGQTEVLGTFKGGQEVEMIDEHHEEERQGEMMEEPKERASKRSNEEEGPGEEATLDFFDDMPNDDDAKENGVIDAQGCQKLQEENEDLEFFDAKSDHGDNKATEITGAQTSKGKVLGEVGNKQNRLEEQRISKVSDDQTRISKGCEAENHQLSNKHPRVRWPSEITGTWRTSISASPPLEHQTTAPKHSEQAVLGTSEADKNENSEALLTKDVICSPKSQPKGHRGRGRPHKLKIQETFATSLSSPAGDYDQQFLESKVEDRETSGPDMCKDTHHIDQQQLKLPRGRGRGRGRGRPRIMRQDWISVPETFSPSQHLHHQQSPAKRGRGRPPKQKFDEDTVSKDISTLENDQQERKGRGRGRGRGCGGERPSRGRKREKESIDTFNC